MKPTPYPLSRIPAGALFIALALLLGTAGGIELEDHSAEFAAADQVEAQQVAEDETAAAVVAAREACPNSESVVIEGEPVCVPRKAGRP